MIPITTMDKGANYECDIKFSSTGDPPQGLLDSVIPAVPSRGTAG